MKDFKRFLKKHWLAISIIALAVALFFTILYFIRSIEASYSAGELRPQYHPRHMDPIMQVQTHQLTIDDIQPWMTFDYINVVFKLPSSFLKNILGISDPRYPNIRIDTYARETKINQTLLLQTIKKYITTNQTH